MRKILNIIYKDLAVLLTDWAAVLLVIAGPLALTLGMGLVTGAFDDQSAPAIQRIPLLIVDQDGGEMSTALVDVLSSDDLSELIDPQLADDAATARAQVAEGEYAAAVIIPPGFSAAFTPDLATGELPPAVPAQVLADPGSPIRAAVVRSIVEEFAARAGNGVSAVRLAITQLVISGDVPTADLPALGRAMGEALIGGEDTSAASLIRIERQTATPTEEPFNLLSYFAPAMALLFLMYAVTLGARTLLSERREGTLARMLAAPVTTGQVLSGKIGGIFTGGFLQLATLIVLTTVMLRLDWGNPLGVLLIVICAALAATGWGVLIASAAANAGQVSNMGMALTLIFGILGGGFGPVQDAGPVLNTLSLLTPNRWALDGFLALMGGGSLAGIAPNLAALLIMAVVLFAVSAVVLRRRQGALLTA